jgi:hypothetical protein
VQGPLHGFRQGDPRILGSTYPRNGDE